MYNYQFKARNQLTPYQIKKILKHVPEWGNIQESIRDEETDELFLLALNNRRSIVGISVISDYEDRYSSDPVDLKHELNIFVLPDHRKKGIGRGMIEQIFRRTKIKKLKVHLTDSGEPFFNALGCKEYSYALTKVDVFWDSQTFLNPLTFRNISIRTAKRLPVTHPAKSIAEYLTTQHFKNLHKKQKERSD